MNKRKGGCISSPAASIVSRAGEPRGKVKDEMLLAWTSGWPRPKCQHGERPPINYEAEEGARVDSATGAKKLHDWPCVNKKKETKHRFCGGFDDVALELLMAPNKNVPALFITWAQNLSVGFRRNDGPDERSEKLLQYRIINVLWEPRTQISEERQPVLTPRSVSLFSIFLWPNKKIKKYRFHFKVWSFKHDLRVDPWPALYFTNCPQGLCLHEKRSVKIDQSSEDQWEMMIAAQGSKTSRRQPSILYRLRWCRLAELIFCRW